jgi:hypothetical protein
MERLEGCCLGEGGYLIPEEFKDELLEMLKEQRVIIGKPISIPLILEGDLISFDDEVES